MGKMWQNIFYTTFFILTNIFGTTFLRGQEIPVTSLPGHLEKLSSNGRTVEIETLDHFLSAKHFFRDYVFPLKPVKFKGVLKDSFPTIHWSDDYFLSLSLPPEGEGNEVSVEYLKKQNRSRGEFWLDFHEFVKRYNKTTEYMVDNVPYFLSQDVPLPVPLQCEEIYSQQLAGATMWFSSGGTKSDLHLDGDENLSCLFHGEKEYVLIDPVKNKDKVHLDHISEGYSGVDVDKVDYERYPDMAQVEFVTTHNYPGDCIFIPHTWAHHVRSHHRNIAVNIWINPTTENHVDLSKCPEEVEDPITLDEIEFVGFSDYFGEDNARDLLERITFKGYVSVNTLFRLVTDNKTNENDDESRLERKILLQIVKILDKNADKVISRSEVEYCTTEEMKEIRDLLWEIGHLFKIIQYKSIFDYTTEYDKRPAISSNHYELGENVLPSK